jgi:FAD/FMN-containing dehydrogenase
MQSLGMEYLSWGRARHYEHYVFPLSFIDTARDALRTASGHGRSVLAYGLGRSYGDSCLNDQEALLDTRALDRFIAFDATNGELQCEAGVSLADVLGILTSRPLHEPRWFLPVTPGTKFVTVGGAIANDVHGKNHHTAGCFGSHVRSLRLLRSDGTELDCSPERNAELFSATIGGLGLTGLILSACIRLKRVPGFWLEAEEFRYDTLDAFFELSEESAADWEYTMAWVDCLGRGRHLGRGVFSRSRHTADKPGRYDGSVSLRPSLSVPVDLPEFILNRHSVRAFNSLYWRRFPRQPRRRLRAIDPILYPLDAIAHWNRLYGAQGFFQYQCVVPMNRASDTVSALLDRASASGEGSFLSVLKVFGNRPSPGLLSFPMHGATLALDFPNRGRATLDLLEALDRIVRDAGGRLYPAKDGRMSADDFQQGFPRWRELARCADPAFSSTFWRRVTIDCASERAP